MSTSSSISSSAVPSTLVYEAKQSTLVPPRGKRAALLIADVQNDFLSGGPVAHQRANEVISVINKLRNTFRFELVCISQDWHPQNHVSFVASHLATKNVKSYSRINVPSSAGEVAQLLWPTHCVQNTEGAELPPALQVYPSDVIIKKGQSATEDSPSLFFDDQSVSTQLGHLLSRHHISDVFITGIGLDHSLGRTALEVVEQGLSAFVVDDAVASLQPENEESVRVHLEKAGVNLVRYSVLAEEREDKKRDTVQYLQKHNVLPVFEKLCAGLVYHKPSDPAAYLIQELQKLQESEGVLSVLSLFNDNDIDAYFNSMDPTKKGVLDGVQAKAALEGLGASADMLHINHDDTFAAAEFKVLVKRAMERKAMAAE